MFGLQVVRSLLFYKITFFLNRKELQDAKKYKANQQEYDALAQIITKHPDREQSEKEIKIIQAEIESLDKGIVLIFFLPFEHDRIYISSLEFQGEKYEKF